MSGLFDSLAARFAPGDQPAIRPRPQARFEGDPGGDGIEERHGERLARAPRRTDAAPRSPQSVGDAPRDDPPTRSASADRAAVPNAPSAAAAPRTEHATVADRRPRESRAEAPPTEPPVAAPRETDRRGDPPAPPAPDHMSAGPQKEADPPAPAETVTERIIETVHRAAAPQQPSHAPEAALESAPVAAEAPHDPAPEPPTIRIGRIEVTRPAPPAPQPSPPPQPARPEPPRRPAPAPRSRQPSGLTDYLGWKKR